MRRDVQFSCEREFLSRIGSRVGVCREKNLHLLGDEFPFFVLFSKTTTATKKLLTTIIILREIFYCNDCIRNCHMGNNYELPSSNQFWLKLYCM